MKDMKDHDKNEESSYPYTSKLNTWIWKTLRQCKWKIGSPGMHWVSFTWGL